MSKVQDNQQPITSEDLYERAFADRCQGDYAKAKEGFLAILRSDPTHIRARWQLALIKGFEGDFDGSLQDLKQISETVPGNIDIRYDYGMTLMMLGMVDEARAQFEAILAIEPGHEKARQQLSYFT